MRVLILGGTTEARHLAETLTLQGNDVLTSLAGAVTTPLLPPGAVRVGGFRGVDGLVELIGDWRPDVLVDATHPFASQITRHAAAAGDRTGVPLSVLRRPEWEPAPGDRWQLAADLSAAATVVRGLPEGCAFLTTGRRGLDLFAADDREFLVRTVTAPDGPVPVRATLLHDRGPYTVEDEVALMASYGVQVLVSKNSGGDQTAAKLVAARTLGIPVVMVERPALPAGLVVESSVAAVVALLSAAPAGTPSPPLPTGQ